MSFRKVLLSIFGIAVVLILGVAIVSAQGNGNTNGNNGNNTDAQTANCVSPQDGTGTQTQTQAHNGNHGAYGYRYIIRFGEPTDAVLTDDIIKGLMVTLQDEYAAYDTYSAIIDQLGEVIPFVNLRDAEATHALALERIFLRYGLTLPERLEIADVPEFSSVSEACTWAYDIEVANVGLYDTYLPLMSDYPDMTQVMTSLRDASLNSHIPALENCAG